MGNNGKRIPSTKKSWIERLSKGDTIIISDNVFVDINSIKTKVDKVTKHSIGVKVLNNDYVFKMTGENKGAKQLYLLEANEENIQKYKIMRLIHSVASNISEISDISIKDLGKMEEHELNTTLSYLMKVKSYIDGAKKRN